MKVVMEFSIPEDEHELEMFQNARKYYLALNAIYSELRSRTKYGHDTEGTWDEAYELFWELCNDSEVDPV